MRPGGEAAEVAPVLRGALVLGGLLGERREVAARASAARAGPRRSAAPPSSVWPSAAVALLHLHQDVAGAGLPLPAGTPRGGPRSRARCRGRSRPPSATGPRGRAARRRRRASRGRDRRPSSPRSGPGSAASLGWICRAGSARVGEHVLELHLLVAPRQLALDLGVARRRRPSRRGSAGSRSAAGGAVDSANCSSLMPCRSSRRRSSSTPMKRPSSWFSGSVRDRARHGLVRDGDPEPLRLELDQPLAHQRLEGLLLDLPQHRPLRADPGTAGRRPGAGGSSVRWNSPTEIGSPPTLTTVSPGVPAPARLEGRDVQDDEGRDHQPQKNVEPAAVPAHQCESHGVSVRCAAPSSGRKSNLRKVAILCPARRPARKP